MIVSDEVQKAYELAKQVQSRAYAPYSKFYVGAAMKLINDENIYIGCNVENASIGNTICAERNALNASVAQMGKRDLEFMVIVCDTQEATPPCGICLQSLTEFSTKDTPFYLANKEKILMKLTFGELLPYSFDSF